MRRETAFLLLVFLLVCSAAFAQQITVKGKVVDKNNEPLVGISVQISGTKTGVSTNEKGEYSIFVSSDKVELSFSYIGFVTQKQVVGSRRTINVTLLENVEALSEIVVIGYGQLERKDLTGSVASISGAEITKTPVTSIGEALTGKLPGVQVTMTEGEPGAELKIRIRGGGSITQDNSPLYIIDGFPTELGLDGLDPNDVQSIDVLKDASSTSIYGARGANGVIIVTTKKGTEGKLKVNYNGYYGARQLPKTLEVLNPYEFVLMQWERQSRNRMSAPDYRDVLANYGEFSTYKEKYQNAPYIDWQDLVMGRSASVQSHNLSLSGGSKDTKYTVSTTRNNEEGIINDSDMKRNTVRLSLDHKTGKRLSFSMSAQYMDRTINGDPVSETSLGYSKLVNVLQFRPVAIGNSTLDDLLNDELDETLADGSTSSINPLFMTKATQRQRNRKATDLNGGITYKVANNLTFKSNLGHIYYRDQQQLLYTAITSTARARGGASAELKNQEMTKWNISNTLTYAKKFAKKHAVTAMLGQEANRLDFYQTDMIGNAFVNEDITFGNLSQAQNQAISSDKYAEAISSFFGRVNYDYKSRYLLSASLRADGSSKFAKDNQWGYFPAVSGAWRISEEGWYKGAKKIVNDLKLRYSYGSSGNNRITNYLYSTNFTPVYYGLNSTSILGLIPSSLANPYLQWETTKTSNYGLDWATGNNRISGTIEYYHNKISNLLLYSDIGTVSGYTRQMSNVGSTQNTGLEFSARAVIIDKKDFSWTANINISANRNKVLSLAGDQQFMLAGSGWGSLGTDFLVKVGQPIGQIYGYRTNGMYTADDFTDAAFTSGAFTSANLKPGIPYNNSQGKEDNLLGLPKIKRINSPEDSETTTPDLDREVIGNTLPKHFGGFNTSFRYKNFDLGIFLNWSYGNDVYNATRLRGSTLALPNQNILKAPGQRYSVIDPVTGAPVLTRSGLNELNKNATQYSFMQIAEILTEDYIEDGSFLRVNNVSLGYTLPNTLVKKIGLQSVRVYATGYNLYLFTNYSGYDPEVDTRRGSALTPGVDFAAYPRSKQYVFGLNVSF